MRKIIASLLIIICSGPLFARSGHLEIQRGEKWYGLGVRSEYAQVTALAFDSDIDGPYMTRLLLSTTGRYLWSSTPFTVEVKGGRLEYNSGYDEVVSEKTGKTLREAYLISVHKNIDIASMDIDDEIFSTPVYEIDRVVCPVINQENVMGYARKLIEEGFPGGILLLPDWLSVNDPRGYDREKYPDPAGLKSGLERLGFKLVVNVMPELPAYGNGYMETSGRGALLMNNRGRVNLIEGPGGVLAAYDLAINGVARQFRDDMAAMLDIFPNDGILYDRNFISVEEMDYKYLEQFNSLFNDRKAIRLKDGLPEYGEVPLILKMGSGEDEETEAVINKYILYAMNGISSLLYKPSPAKMGKITEDQRSMAEYLALQLSLPLVYINIAPWRITDDQMYTNIKNSFALREKMSGYLKELSKESNKTAEPLIRHLEYQYPRTGFADCDDQFMVGSRYLIAPCTGTADKRMVRLPKGTWIDRNGKRLRGPMVTEVRCNGGEIIYFEANQK